MTLGFKTEIEGKQTYFVDKILEGLRISNLLKQGDYDKYVMQYERLGVSFSYLENPKIQTIRRDEKDRWKVGNKIHFVIGNRTKERLQFAPVLPVTSIQKIRIVWGEPDFGDINGLRCTFYKSTLVYVYVDDVAIYGAKLMALARNDGFDNVADFLEWFSSDFTGKIIHWTDTLHYN